MSTNAARTHRLIRGVLLATAVVAPAAAVQAETTVCTQITSVPTTITTPGVYCFKGNLDLTSAACNAITIEADDVVLDLNGHTLDGTALGPSALSFGILGVARRNITIRNGTIRGFFYGINLGDSVHPPWYSGGHLIEDIRADRNTCTGIVLTGRGSVVRRNLIVDTGGQTWSGADDASGWGMQITGAGIRILDNDIDTVIKRGSGVATGISLSGSPDAFVVGNRIAYADRAVVFDWASWGKFRDNLTSAVAVRYTGGTDAGNNN